MACCQSFFLMVNGGFFADSIHQRRLAMVHFDFYRVGMVMESMGSNPYPK